MGSDPKWQNMPQNYDIVWLFQELDMSWIILLANDDTLTSRLKMSSSFLEWDQSLKLSRSKVPVQQDTTQEWAAVS